MTERPVTAGTRATGRLADADLHQFERGFRGRPGMSPSGRDELAIYEALRGAHHISTALVVADEGQQRYRGNNGYVTAVAANRP